MDKKLSAVLVIGERRKRGKRALDALCAQTIAKAIEIVVIDLVPEGTPPLTTNAHITTIYRTYPGIIWARARVIATELASAPIVAFIEDHVIVEPDWAETLVRAHQGPWAAVSYAFTCANPETYIARGILLAEYGRWQAPTVSGAATLLPCGNVSYKRDALLAMGDELENLLTPDFALHERLTQMGLPLYIEAQAIVAHQSFVRWFDITSASIIFCRLLADHRAKTQKWNWLKRMAYALATPFVSPPIALARLAASMHHPDADRKSFLIYLPILIWKSIASAAGESLGYVSRGKDTDQKFSWLELNAPRDYVE